MCPRWCRCCLLRILHLDRRLKDLQRFLQQRPIGSEVLVHTQRAAQRDHRDQVGGHHLLVHIVLRGGCGLVDFVRLHGAEIEKQDDEPPVFQGPGGEDGRSVGALRLSRAKQCRFCRSGRKHSIGIFQIERNHLLRLVIFENGKVLALEVAHRIAVLVAHSHVHQHQFGLRAERVLSWTIPVKQLRSTASR